MILHKNTRPSVNINQMNESLSVSDFFPSLTSGNTPITFDRCLSLPPDAITIQNGIEGSAILAAQRVGIELYRPELKQNLNQRVLDLGCGVGSFVVAMLARTKSNLDIVALDKDKTSLEYAKANIGMAISETQSPSISASFINDNWLNSRIWNDIGLFDLVYFNPPYLTSDQQLLAGYENVPKDHLYNDAPELTYSEIGSILLDHLSEGGSLMMRTSSNTPISSITNQIKIHGNNSYTFYELLKPFTPERWGHTIIISKWPETLAPYADPRVIVYMDTGKDIGK